MGEDPNMSIARLSSEWVERAVLIHVGQTGSEGSGTLKERIGRWSRFGRGKPVGHRGGSVRERVVCPSAGQQSVGVDSRECKNDLIDAFELEHGVWRPFANMRG